MSEILERLLRLVVGAFVVIVGISVWKAIYNLYFHPLAKYPGPKLAAVSDIWYGWSMLAGHFPQDVAKLHERYGDIVRIAVNDLSFATLEAQKAIHSHAGKDKAQFLKSSYYFRPSGQSIVTERDLEVHREMRKMLSHAFSAAALRDQTDVVMGYVDLFISQLKKFGTGEEGVIMTTWYDWLTFDVIGDLTFGESFGAVENAKTHPWTAIIVDAAFSNQYLDVFRRMPWTKLFSGLFLNRKELVAKLTTHLVLTEEKIDKRINNAGDNDRSDFFGHIIKKKAVDTDKKFILAQSSTLIVAGSETTATFLSSATYCLFKNPEVLTRLQDEVRAAFTSDDEITAEKIVELGYLFAVCEEGLRMFPPVSFGLPRVSPGANLEGHYIPAGTTVSASNWAINRSSKYFHNPNSFAPERWLPENHPFYDTAFASDQKEASKPFSSGSRVCIGINLAYLEMRLVLAKLIWNFDMRGLNLAEVDFERDAKMQFLWKKPELRVGLLPVARN